MTILKSKITLCNVIRTDLCKGNFRKVLCFRTRSTDTLNDVTGSINACEPSALQEPIISSREGLTSKEETVMQGRLHVLMMLIQFTNGPIGITASEQGVRVPTREQKVIRFRDIITIHLTKDVHGGLLDLIVCHLLDLKRHVLSHCDEKDVGRRVLRQVTLGVQVLPGIKIASAIRISPDDKLAVIPEFSRKVHKDLGIRRHVKGVDAFHFPLGQGWTPLDVLVFHDTYTNER